MLSFHYHSSILAFFFALAFSDMITSVLCHGYIKFWSPDNGKTFEKGHKQPLAKSALRDVSENTGFVGSKFLTNPAITCGSSSTPSQRIAAPGGQAFSDASQSAGKTMAVKPGASVHLIVADDPGQGFPHDNGHIQTYLGYCGESTTACENFDAASIPYFKIQSEKDGLGNKEKFKMNKRRDGNEWSIPIPNNLPKGGYIMRTELIALNQGTEAEGKQDQWYIYCGQISLSDPTAKPVDLSQLDTVKFPGAYQNGKLDPKSETLPGPKVFKPESDEPDKIIQTSQRANSKSSEHNSDAPNFDNKISFNDSAPDCAKLCINQNYSNLASKNLSENCDFEQDQDCLCSNEEFVQDFINCARDKCQAKCEAESVINEFNSQCKIPSRINCGRGPNRMS